MGTRPTAIDLFCGCGGLTEGLRIAGFRVLAAVDNDAYALESYRANHRGVRVWEGDIKRVAVSTVLTELKLKPGQLDLLAGCPPCQGFSTVRTLNGSRRVSDDRNDLLFEYLRFARVMRPRRLMLENVPGLADDRRFKKFTARLRALGYKVEYRVVDAADHGVPQRRKRLIMLAGPPGAPITFPLPSKRKVTVRDAIACLPAAGRSGDALHDLPESRSPKVASLIARIPKNGGSRLDLPKRMQLACHRRSSGFSDVYGRMSWDSVSPTITSGCHNPSKGRFLHPTRNRAVTLREAALLQGFRKDYRFPKEVKKEKVALMIGNALPPPLIAAHASFLKP